MMEDREDPVPPPDSPLPSVGDAAPAAPAAIPATRLRRKLLPRLLRELTYVVVLGTPVVLFFLVARPRSNAGRLLRNLAAVQVNQTTFNQVVGLAAEFGSSAACVGDNCLFQFQNRWLYRLHLAPLTQFSVMVQRGGSPGDPGGGKVGALDMAMMVTGDPDASRPGNGTIASALVFDRVGGQPPFQATITFGEHNRPLRTVVTLSPAATPHQRARARGFNLQCLTRLGGCKNSHDLLTGIWQGANRVESVANRPAALPR